MRKDLVRKTCLGLIFVAGLGGCKISNISSGNLSSFRSENGERTVAVGFYLNDYPTVTDGAFFPFELFNYDDEELEEMGDSFKGYSGDVMTGKEPFGGFISEQAITEAKSRKLKDPYHFAGYFLKIMVVHNNIEQLPVEIDLQRGFFPPDFVCPRGIESIKIKADDRALGYPGGGKSLVGDDTYINRIDRQVTFCRVNEVNGPYAGKPLYYTRVELFDKSEDYLDELYDLPRSYEHSPLIDKLPGVHEELAVAIRFKYKNSVDGKVDFNINNTVVNLDYNVVPRLNEMLEVLQQNSVANYNGIVESTDMVQEYLYRNRNRAENDGEWQLLKVAQRKWLAIRMILLLLGKNINEKAETLRLHILESIELANLNDLYPLAKKITSYANASDYIDEMTNNPEKSVADAKDWFKGNSHRHFNKMIYQLAIEAGLRQWYFSKQVYNNFLQDTYDRYIVEHNNGQEIVPLCSNSCSSSDRDYIISKKQEFTETYKNLTPIGERELHQLFSRYVKAINAVYPDPYKGASAEFKRTLKLQIWQKSLDYANSSDTYKSLYESYSRRYDLVFSEPHGLLLGADAIQNQVQPKRKPDDVNIVTDDGKTSYHWKMHPPADIITMKKAVTQMLDGIYETIKELIKIKNSIDTASAQQQVKITSDFGDLFHVSPIAQALLIRPDYTYVMKDVLRKYSRVRATTVVRHVVFGLTIATTLAGGALFVASLMSLASAGIVGAVFAGAGAADLLGASISFLQARGLRYRIERALFAESLGTNIAVYHQSRQQYYKVLRDLYWSAGFAALDMAAFVSTGFKFLKTRRQLNALKNVWGENKYPNVLKHLRRCSTPYCRKFLRFSPVLGNGDADELGKIFRNLNEIKFNDFKSKIEKLWLTNPNFRPLLYTELAVDSIRTTVLKMPWTNFRIRVPGSHNLKIGLNNARMIYLAKLTDANFLSRLNVSSKKLKAAKRVEGRPDEILNMTEVLLHGRQRTKKFIVFPRNQVSVLQNNLSMNDKEWAELFKRVYGNDQTMMGWPENAKKTKFFSRKRKKDLRDLYNEKLEEIKGENIFVERKVLDEIVEIGLNQERVKILKNNFDDLMGDLANYDKNTKKLILNETLINEVFNTKKWQKIIEDITKQGGDVENLKQETIKRAEQLVKNLNEIVTDSLVAYNRRMKSINEIN